MNDDKAYILYLLLAQQERERAAQKPPRFVVVLDAEGRELFREPVWPTEVV